MTLAPAYSGDKSKIVLSFCNANGGHILAHWLRNELMKDLNYYSPNSVYLDNVATRSFGDVESTVRHAGLSAPGAFGIAKAEGIAKGAPIVGPDTRAAFGGVTPIGAMYVDAAGTPDDKATWFVSWKSALKQAIALIQIQTDDYFTSTPCAQEMANIEQYLTSSNKLTVIAITVTDRLPKMSHSSHRYIPLQLGPTVPHPVAQLSAFGVLSKTSFVILKDQLIKLGC